MRRGALDGKAWIKGDIEIGFFGPKSIRKVRVSGTVVLNAAGEERPFVLVDDPDPFDGTGTGTLVLEGEPELIFSNRTDLIPETRSANRKPYERRVIAAADGFRQRMPRILLAPGRRFATQGDIAEHDEIMGCVAAIAGCEIACTPGKRLGKFIRGIPETGGDVRMASIQLQSALDRLDEYGAVDFQYQLLIDDFGTAIIHTDREKAFDGLQASGHEQLSALERFGELRETALIGGSLDKIAEAALALREAIKGG